MKKLTDQQLPPIYLGMAGKPSTGYTPDDRFGDRGGSAMAETRSRVTTLEGKVQYLSYPDSPIHSEKRLDDICVSPITDYRQNDSKIVEFSNSVGRVVSGEFDTSVNSEVDTENSLNNISVSLTETARSKHHSDQTPDGLFLSRQVLNPWFHRLCHQFLLEQYYSKKMYEPWRFSDLYRQFSTLNIANPFIQTPLTGKFSPNETICSLFERWIFNYEDEPELILSIDFVLNHPTMILCLVFYWVQSGQALPPFCSSTERDRLQAGRNKMRQNILKILDDQRDWRPREITRNFVLFKLISEFYKWIIDTPMFSLAQPFQRHIKESWKLIHETWLVGEDIKKTMAISDSTVLCYSEHDMEMLEKIYNNYECKDKMILDRMVDIADLFDDVDRNQILMTPLSDYFQTGLGESSMKKAATRHTQLSCWLLSFVVRKARNSLDLAVAYINRYIELFQEFYKRENYQSAMLFAGVIASIKSFMPSIWGEVMERSPTANLDSKIDQLVEAVQVASFDSRGDRPPLFSNTASYRLLEAIKSQSRKQYLNLSFHRTVQKLARKIVQCRRWIQKFNSQKRASAVRLNLNQRFLGNYIYEVFRRDSQLCQAPQYHQELKREARKLDKNYQL